MPRSMPESVIWTRLGPIICSAPGTGEPEDMGYGEYLVRDALHSWHGPKDQVLVATKPAGCARLTATATTAGRPTPDLKP